MVNFCLYVTLAVYLPFLSDGMGVEHAQSFAQVLFLATSVYSFYNNELSFAERLNRIRRKPLRYGTIVSNGGFGNPVIEGIYGTNGLFYASVFMLPVRIVSYVECEEHPVYERKSESLVKRC